MAWDDVAGKAAGNNGERNMLLGAYKLQSEINKQATMVFERID
ncbi:MAG: hypothetical protein V8R18_05150 [Clostridium sp.]